MTARFTLEMPEELLARVDDARGDIPRNTWIRRQIERVLAWEGQPVEIAIKDMPAHPAAYRQHVPGLNVEHVRSSSQAKRNTKPYPKRAR